MKAELQGQFSFFRKRYEIPGKIKFLETITSFKIAEAVVKPVGINKIWEPLLRAAFDSFGEKRIIRRQVTASDL